MTLEPWQWLAALVITFAAAVVQGTIGFGYAVLAVPLLSLLDTRLAPVPQILTALPMTVWAACREWSRVDWKGALWIVVGRIPGVAVGALLLSIATPRLLDLLIGSFVLLAVLLLRSEVRVRRSPMVDFSAGLVGTITGYVSGIGGPPIALLFRDADGPTIRATLGVIFSFGVLLAIGGRAVMQQITLLDASFALVLLGPMLAGMLLSRRLHALVKGPILRRAVLTTSAFAALGLIGRALF